MDIITKDDFMQNKSQYFTKIIAGAVFIHATDTIYGLACNALDEKAVARIREIKQREKKPFSVIAPSRNWIFANCQTYGEARKYINKLPGPYTLLLPLTNSRCVARNVILDSDAIGIRIPAHWFTEIITILGFPTVTTSVNIAGEKPIASYKDVDKSITNKIDFFIDEGKLKGKPSDIIDLRKKEIEIIER